MNQIGRYMTTLKPKAAKWVGMEGIWNGDSPKEMCNFAVDKTQCRLWTLRMKVKRLQ